MIIKKNATNYPHSPFTTLIFLHVLTCLHVSMYSCSFEPRAGPLMVLNARPHALLYSRSPVTRSIYTPKLYTPSDAMTKSL